MQRLLFVIAVVMLTANRTLAGSVITSNLPPNVAAIVNVDAKQDGAASFDGGQDNWFHPFFTGGATSLLQYTIAPGFYTFQLTNPTLSANQYPALTSSQLGQMFTAWTYNSPWVTDYFAFDSAGASNFSVPQIFAGAIRPAGLGGGTSSATEAFNFAVTNHFDNIIVKQPGGRVTGVRASQYGFATSETLTFAIPDNILSDNNGGLSVVISRTGDGIPGDYNGNGAVDAADYVLWRNGGPLQNEIETLGSNTPEDYTAWRARYGNYAGSGVGDSYPASGGTSVPEPMTPLLVAIGALATTTIRTRKYGRIR
ncbi:MAG TPA: hypothetical protein VHU84_14090 [Lacipirellulaceae bacterium]|jgi:hypothetical protein|nr:hypothetical protein [Lacipirellulaceae bacterium]